MCELFAISSRVPTSAGYSIGRLSRHGGAEGPHRDGWGIAYYAGRDVQLLREPVPASDSKLIAHYECCAPPSTLVLSHLRLASFGDRALGNTQPFVRELGGRMHVFAHNGDLATLLDQGAPRSWRFRPVGQTDSERACCMLMDRIAWLWSDTSERVPPLDARLAVIAAFAAEMRKLGPANFIYSDGDTLFAHAHRRTVPGDDAVLPGLYLLTRNCREGDPGATRPGDTGEPREQSIALVASVPLTDEQWRPLGAGELLAIAGGKVLGTVSCA